jgi:hypothetical protein
MDHFDVLPHSIGSGTLSMILLPSARPSGPRHDPLFLECRRRNRARLARSLLYSQFPSEQGKIRESSRPWRVRLTTNLWGEPSRIALRSLRELTAKYSLSIAAGDLQFLDGRWYVTHSGLLRLASRRGCRGINTTLVVTRGDTGVG